MHFCDLPDTIMLHIFHHLPPKSLLALTSLQRRLNKLSLGFIANELKDNEDLLADYMIAAVECGHIAGFKAAEAGGADFSALVGYDSVNAEAVSPKARALEAALVKAFESGNEAFARFLLPYVTDFELKDLDDEYRVPKAADERNSQMYFSLMKAAAERGREELVRLLVDNDPRLEACGNDPFRGVLYFKGVVFDASCRCDFLALVQLLLDIFLEKYPDKREMLFERLNKVEIPLFGSQSQNRFESPLRVQYLKGNMEMFKALVDMGFESVSPSIPKHEVPEELWNREKYRFDVRNSTLIVISGGPLYSEQSVFRIYKV